MDYTVRGFFPIVTPPIWFVYITHTKRIQNDALPEHVPKIPARAAHSKL